MKKPKSIIINEEEMKVFIDLLDREKGMVEVIKATQALWVGMRVKLNQELEILWERLIKKYKLKKDKDFSLNKETGEITIINVDELKTQKEGTKNDYEKSYFKANYNQKIQD